MSSKKSTTKKEGFHEGAIVEAPKELDNVPVSIPSDMKKKEYKANRNFFFAGKNWFEGNVIDLPGKDIEFLVSKGVIS